MSNKHIALLILLVAVGCTSLGASVRDFTPFVTTASIPIGANMVYVRPQLAPNGRLERCSYLFTSKSNTSLDSASSIPLQNRVAIVAIDSDGKATTLAVAEVPPGQDVAVLGGDFLAINNQAGRFTRIVEEGAMRCESPIEAATVVPVP
jgi:hypothetical protein